MRITTLSVGLLLGFSLSACTDDSTDDREVVVNTENNENSQNVNNANSRQNNDIVIDTSGPDINDQCPPEARPVYVVEADVDDPSAQGKLVRFDAPELTFTEIGDLDCPTTDDDTPFSMSVDREGIAWVLYQSGNLFRVETKDAACEATSFQPGQAGFQLFGMGFTLVRPDEQDETLFIAGGSDPGSAVAPRLGAISFPDLTVQDVTTIGGWPEMSGTADADLWAFFPSSAPPRVAKVNIGDGSETNVIPIDSIDGAPNAWAFAHWGGQFYLFYKSQTDLSTRVFRVDKTLGEAEEVIPDSGRYIVGAGVSTCAPTVAQ